MVQPKTTRKPFYNEKMCFDCKLEIITSIMPLFLLVDRLKDELDNFPFNYSYNFKHTIFWQVLKGHYAIII